ncbi:hypothetical protein MHYP_G00172490 [Metynnis hypsauchen]
MCATANPQVARVRGACSVQEITPECSPSFSASDRGKPIKDLSPYPKNQLAIHVNEQSNIKLPMANTETASQVIQTLKTFGRPPASTLPGKT